MGVTGSVTTAGRWWIALLLFALALGATPVAALTLGDLVVESRPGEPLRAVIPFTLAEGEPMAELHVVPASEATYAQRGLERPALLEQLRIALLAKGEERGRIQLFGDEPWQGEEVKLWLQLNWPGGELIKRYRIAPVEASGEKKTPLYVEVGKNESLAAVAIRLSKHSNRSYRHMMVALYRANPDAFYRDNLNNLKGGVTLRVPTQEELYRLSDGEVTRVMRDHQKRWQAEREQQQQQQQRQEKKERRTQQLEQVTREGSELEQRNQELKERLARLEREMSQMSRKVLDYAPQRKAASEPPEQDEPAPTAVQSSEAEADKPKRDQGAQGLSGIVMVLLMLLVVGTVLLFWRFSPRAGKGE